MKLLRLCALSFLLPLGVLAGVTNPGGAGTVTTASTSYYAFTANNGVGPYTTPDTPGASIGVQMPGGTLALPTDYTISGKNLTLSSGLASAVANQQVVWIYLVTGAAGGSYSTLVTATLPFRVVTGTTDSITSADANGKVSFRNTGAITETLPSTCMADGFQVEFEQGLAGQVTVVSGGANVTLASDKLTPSYVTARQGTSIVVAYVKTGTNTCTALVKGNTQ